MNHKYKCNQFVQVRDWPKKGNCTDAVIISCINPGKRYQVYHDYSKLISHIIPEKQIIGFAKGDPYNGFYENDGSAVGNPNFNPPLDLNRKIPIKITISDNVNNPKHYNSDKIRCVHCSKPIECIDISKHFGFALGNCIKYIWRESLKNAPIEDLKKASWYLTHEIQERRRK